MKKIMKRIKEQTPLSRLKSTPACRQAGLPLKKGEVLKRNGFTLVEMLVVISIIGILSAFLAGGYVNSQKSARDATRKINLKSISDALNSYYADNGFFPNENQLRDPQGAFLYNGILYMKKVPIESGGMGQLSYKVSTINKKSFRLFTNLENDEDKDCVTNAVCTSLGYSNSKGCCYIVTSSNIGTTSTLP